MGKAWRTAFAAADAAPAWLRRRMGSRPCGRFARSPQGSQDIRLACQAAPAGWCGRQSVRDAMYLIGNLGLQLAGLGDQLLDRLLGREHSDQLSSGVDLSYVLREPRGIAECQLADRRYACCANQPDLGFSHPGDAHVVGDVRPFQQLLLADTSLCREGLASLDGVRGIEECVGGTNAQRFELGSPEGGHAFNLRNWICHSG